MSAVPGALSLSNQLSVKYGMNLIKDILPEPCLENKLGRILLELTPVAVARRGPYNPRMSFVYILRCGDGSLYTGITKDVPKRLKQHQAGKASKYTRVHLPVTLSWTRQVRSWSHALKEERRIKALTRTQKEALLRAEQEQSPETP